MSFLHYGRLDAMVNGRQVDDTDLHGLSLTGTDCDALLEPAEKQIKSTELLGRTLTITKVVYVQMLVRILT